MEIWARAEILAYLMTFKKGIGVGKLKLIRGVIWLSIVVFLCSGFRVFHKDQPWDRLARTPAASTKLFVLYDQATRTLENNLPAEDPLAGSATITVEQAMDSIFTDYNNIAAAYVTLVDGADADYNSTNAAGRTIRIFNRGTDGLNGGEAKFKTDNDGIVSCEISLIDDMYKDAKIFISVATHEIGHCLGLDHPQEITNSVMSYFGGSDIYRLQTDDKMGIVFLYPTDQSKAREDATMGLSCSRR